MPVEATTGLYIPTLEEFATFKGFDAAEDFDEPESQITLFLSIAADLLILRTGLKKAPQGDTPVTRMVSYGIMDLAWFLGTTSDEWTSMFSPFSSERIGSYTYSKSVSAAQAKRDLLDAPLFDAACHALLNSEQEEVDSGVKHGIGFATEHVFPQSFHESNYRDTFPDRTSRGGVFW